MLIICNEQTNELVYLDESLTEPSSDIFQRLQQIYGANASFIHFTQSITMDDVRKGAPYVQNENGVLTLMVNQAATQIQPQPPSIESRVASLEDAVTVLMGL